MELPPGVEPGQSAPEMVLCEHRRIQRRQDEKGEEHPKKTEEELVYMASRKKIRKKINSRASSNRGQASRQFWYYFQTGVGANEPCRIRWKAPRLPTVTCNGRRVRVERHGADLVFATRRGTVTRVVGTISPVD